MAYEVNGKNVGALGYAGLMALGLVAVTARVIVQPWRLGRLKAFIVSGWRDGQRIWLTAPEHRHRITFEEVETTPSLRRQAEVEALARELAEDRDWQSLAELLEEWDDARAACASNRRLTHVALYAVTRALAGGARDPYDCSPMAQTRIPENTGLELLSLAMASPRSHGMAALAATVLVHQCWDLRGQDTADMVPDSHYMRMDRMIDKAMSLLEAAGVDTRGSGMLATLRLSCLPFLGDPESMIPDWLEVAVKADPGDGEPASIIGNFMLPRWFGDYEDIEISARKVAAWSSDTMGMAGYALVYLSALEMAEEPLYFVDVDLFCTAIEDLVKHRGHSADHLPHISQTLYRLSQVHAPRGMPEDEVAQWQETTHRLYLLSLSVLEHHLTAIHAPSWQGGLNGALDMISLAMGRELEDGADLVVGPKGIAAILPEAPPEG